MHVVVQQIPWTAAHEKLLTAFVGGATPDVAQLGNTWIPEFAALGALEPLDARIARSPALAPGDYFAGIWDTNVVDGDDLRRALVRRHARALLPHATSGARGRRPAAADLGGVAGGDARGSRRCRGAERYAILLPIDEWAQPVILGLQAGAPLLADGGRHGDFRDPRFRRAFDVLRLALLASASRRRSATAQVANLYQQFADGYFAMWITGPWNLGEFRSRLPPELQDDWTTAPLPASPKETIRASRSPAARAW